MSESVLKPALLSHPDHPPPPGLAVSAWRLPPDDPARPLRLRYELAPGAAPVRWPAPLPATAAQRSDGLWRHTCFEAFVAAPAGAGGGYVEFNFAPSGAWAAYRFDGWRAGMRPEPLAAEPRITLRTGVARVEVEVAVAWPAPLPGAPGATPAGSAPPAPRALRLGLTAVIEAADGSLSYWALRHPPGRADFHNDAGFLLEIEVPA